LDTYGFIQDGHGDVTGLVSPAGELVLDYAYDPFGNETTAQTSYAATWDNPFRYCGEYWDEETQTYYLRARQYDPTTGRFLSEDPVQDGLNWYIYCYNDPVQYWDPNGEVPVETIFDFISIGLSLADLKNNPSLANFGYLLWDVGSAILPYVHGSYIVKGTKLLGDVDVVSDIVKGFSGAESVADAARAFKANSKNIIGSYRDLKKTVKSLGIRDMEVHHLIEKRFAKNLGFENTNDMLSMALDKDTHRKITKEIRGIIGYRLDVNAQVTTATASGNQIWAALHKVYTDNGLSDTLPLLKEEIIKYQGNVTDTDYIITDWLGV